MKGPTPEARQRVERAGNDPERIFQALLEVSNSDYSDDYGPLLDSYKDPEGMLREIASTSTSASEAYERFVKLMKEVEEDR